VAYVWQHWQPSFFIVCTMSQHWTKRESRPVVIFVCKHLARFFFEKHAQNLNTPQNNSMNCDWQMGLNWAFKGLSLYLLTWRIWWALNNVSKCQIWFNSAFKGLIFTRFREVTKSGRHLHHPVRYSVALHGKTPSHAGRTFHETLYFVVLLKYVKKVQVCRKSDKNNRQFT